MSLGRRPLRSLSEAVDPAIEHLYCFDMDDTLIQQMLPTEGKKLYKQTTGKDWPYERWWTVPATLRPPFPVKIKAPQKGAFVKAKQDPVGKVIVMTGRVATKEMKSTVASLLTKLGFGPLKFGDNLFLKRLNARDTAAWKISMLTGFTKRFPNLKKISVWEDRADHAQAFEAHIKKLGLEANVIHVKGGQPIAAMESYPNRSWWSVATGSRTGPRRKLKTITGPVEVPNEEPEHLMDNPLPGNMSPRAKQSVPAGRWHDRNKLKKIQGPALSGLGTRFAKLFGKRGGWQTEHDSTAS